MWNEILSNLKENSIALKREGDIFVLFGVIILCLILYLWQNDTRRKLPPGPMGLPIFGYYPFLGKEPERTMYEVAKKYGSVTGLHLGPQYVVFVNDWDALKDAYSQNATIDRPPEMFEPVPYKFGIGGISGDEWVQARRLATRAMKDVGLNNTIWEQLVQEEVVEIVNLIKQEEGRPVDVVNLFRYTFMNNILTLVLGKRLPSGHPFTKFLTHSVEDALGSVPTLGLLNFSPTLTKVLQVLGLEKEFSFAEEFKELKRRISQTVEDVLQNPESKSEESFIVRFQQQIENVRKNNENVLIAEDTFKGTVLALLTGGSDTSKSSLIWLLMAMAENQDKQSRVHEELDRVIGKEGSIRWPERFKVPYTFATILESMRWRTLVPLNAMRKTREAKKIQGYDIPKGTYLTSNIYSLHNDPRYWKDPERLLPERFLLEKGQKVNTAIESFSPFSYGRRNCPGKLMAQMAILQYFCTLMQNFKVVPKEGNTVKYNAVLGLTYQPQDVELRFILR